MAGGSGRVPGSRRRAESGGGIGTGVRNRQKTRCVPNLSCANLGAKSRLSQWPVTRRAVEVGTWLRSLGLNGSTALAVRFDPEDLRDAVVGDPIGAYAARQRGVVD